MIVMVLVVTIPERGDNPGYKGIIENHNKVGPEPIVIHGVVSPLINGRK